MESFQFYLTPIQGKNLIAKAVVSLPQVRKAVLEHTVAIVAGTTNAPVAYELLRLIGQNDGFDSSGFYRGVTVPSRVSPQGEFGGDVIIRQGKWLKGSTIFDIADSLTKDDMIFKGGNAVNLEDHEAGVLLGNPAVGTAQPILTAVYGRRVKLYIPIGLEKRISERISKIAALVNLPNGTGLRLLPLPGEVITELEAIKILTGVKASLIAGGGILGAEGGCYYLAEGEKASLGDLRAVLASLEQMPDFRLHSKMDH